MLVLLVQRELPEGFSRVSICMEPRQSDVDFLATVARPPDAGEVEVLRQLHAELAEYSPIRFDGPYVLVEDLARDPRTVPARPEVRAATPRDWPG